MNGKFLLFLLIVALDQWTKFLAGQHLALGVPAAVIPGLFNFTLVYNPGAAFGMFSELPDAWRRITLAIVSGIALIVVLRFMAKEAKHDRASQYALIAILSGAVGNLIDRYRFDSVVDFLDFYWKNYHWPAFNIADSAISIGVVVLMFRVLFTKSEKAAEADSSGATFSTL
ncbi:MAG: signal peptidase II [Bdellovibrionota bacterium]